MIVPETGAERIGVATAVLATRAWNSPGDTWRYDPDERPNPNSQAIRRAPLPTRPRATWRSSHAGPSSIANRPQRERLANRSIE